MQLETIRYIDILLLSTKLYLDTIIFEEKRVFKNFRYKTRIVIEFCIGAVWDIWFHIKIYVCGSVLVACYITDTCRCTDTTYACTHTHTCTHTPMHTLTHAHTHAHKHTRTHAHTHKVCKPQLLLPSTVMPVHS